MVVSEAGSIRARDVYSERLHVSTTDGAVLLVNAHGAIHCDTEAGRIDIGARVMRPRRE